MAIDYSALQATAAAMLAEFGVSATLRRTTQAFDENTGQVAEAESDSTVSAVLLPQGEAPRTFGSGSQSFSDLFEGATKRERRFGLVSASGLAITPVTGDRLIVAAKTWEVLGVDTLAPDGSTAVLHSMGLQA